MRMLLQFGVVVLVVVFTASPALAAACSGNTWQPTFVHDLEHPDGPWYVMSDGKFTKLTANGSPPTWTADACGRIQSDGIRDRRGFTTCQDYTRIQCGCSHTDLSNRTCDLFLRQHK